MPLFSIKRRFQQSTVDPCARGRQKSVPLKSLSTAVGMSGVKTVAVAYNT